jgi:cobalt/nickel transport system permease protein
LIGWSARKVKQTLDDQAVPLMGVLGAFIFASQMINFSIPATGSSGHLGGGLLLTILLGPHAAFVVIASVLTVQALFFADGGLLALGCNLLNMGFFPAFIAFPLIYRPIVRNARGGARLWAGALLAAIAGLQMGAFSVVLQTTLSGISDLPFRTFVWMMQPIHLAIGVVEGLATAVVVSFVMQTRPAAITGTATAQADTNVSRRLVLGFLVAAVVVGGAVSWFASTHPDGLEWAIARVSGKDEIEAPGDGVHATLARIQERTSFLPDYGFKTPSAATAEGATSPWPAVEAGTSVSGLIGGLIVLALAGLVGYACKPRHAGRTG